MISAVQFRNFKALRSAALRLEPFNLLVGPNGSGKTSLIQACLRLRTLAVLAPAETGAGGYRAEAPQIDFSFAAPHEAIRVRLGCLAEMHCDSLVVESEPAGTGNWPGLRARLGRIRAYLFDHYAIAAQSGREEGGELRSNAGNLAAVLAARQSSLPGAFAELEAEFCRLMPGFAAVVIDRPAADQVVLRFRLAEDNEVIEAESVSQGALYLLALLCLAFDPDPPSMVCLEDIDRGMHPRMLRDVRDALYRLSHPESIGLTRRPVQVIATTHSPYLLDLFKEHPEEIVLANRQGNVATFVRLSDRADLRELLGESHLGDLWYSGILGGVPEA